MANPLTFLRPFHLAQARSILLVQSGPIDLALQVADRVRAMLPECDLDAVVREDDRDVAASAGFTRVVPVRWEDRVDVVRALRRRRYDTVIVLLSHRGSDYLRILPYLLRTRSIWAFNDNLDSFALHVTRVATLGLHVSGRNTVWGLARWLAARAVFGTLAFAILVTSVVRIELRALRRRARMIT